MSVEIAALVVLAWIGWMLWEIRVVIRALVGELSTARWERGKRESLRLEELKRQGR